jgi:hypothetical protein
MIKNVKLFNELVFEAWSNVAVENNWCNELLSATQLVPIKIQTPK